MKKTAIALSVALASFTTVATAATKEDTWYLGDKLGWSQYHNTNLYTKGIKKHTSTVSSIRDHVGAGALVGYQANPYLSLEMGYDWFGQIGYKDGVNNKIFKSQGISMIAKISQPITHNLDIYTRLGGVAWLADYKVDGDPNDSSHVKSRDTGISPLAAVGLEYAWNKQWTARLDYQWTNNIGNVNVSSLRPDNSMLSIGAIYRFGHKDTTHSSTTQRIQTRNIALKSNVLFDFDKTSLKPESREAIDQLYSQLISMNPRDSSFVILGYADHIGSDAYNQKLSYMRAQSVADYLISKGIPSEKISLRGMGEALAVSSSDCNGEADRATVIKCLSQDRRVEIAVKGIKDVAVQ